MAYKSSIFLLMPKLDPDALAYITAAGITNPTQISAVNTLFLNLKSNSLYSKLLAFYPFVGGTAFSHKFNAKDPRDLDAAFRLLFTGTFVHSSTGALPVGAAYANTYIIPSVNLTSTTDFESCSFYSRTNTATASSYSVGSFQTSRGLSCALIPRRNANLRLFGSDYPTGTTSYRTANDNSGTDGRGFFVGSQNGTTLKLYYNGAVAASNTAVSTTNPSRSTFPIYLFGLNSDNTSVVKDDKECAFAHIGYKLTDAEVSTLRTIVQNFQTTLGRQV